MIYMIINEEEFEEFKEEWTRICKILKESGYDLRKIKLVKGSEEA